ncbi:cyclic pyranopterin monophosphate synthase MoaC [Blastopirellula marina]|uniref:Cyclic pyranopterin monophosphate synthase n=1 Tax=Blastopirellula marina TaxID=124 RepID=A0A2S8GLB5_9BACT|nr:cyclic pyranopterin monophosphate synthase MoaC [Blastopirellula marina]PQO45218.1 cyclic pyranopterin monophosphate synthase MoaC [Blastopirellula marina]
MADFTHLDEAGSARMVNVGEKPVTPREAVAEACVKMEAATAESIRENQTKKGEVLQVARLAGIMAAKRTDELIPLCHGLPLESIDVAFTFEDATTLRITATAKVAAKTGVEMEAMTAASVAALTVYDMCKAIDRGMEIRQVRLMKKSGGKSGTYERQPEN